MVWGSRQWWSTQTTTHLPFCIPCVALTRGWLGGHCSCNLTIWTSGTLKAVIMWSRMHSCKLQLGNSNVNMSCLSFPCATLLTIAPYELGGCCGVGVSQVWQRVRFDVVFVYVILCNPRLMGCDDLLCHWLVSLSVAEGHQESGNTWGDSGDTWTLCQCILFKGPLVTGGLSLRPEAGVWDRCLSKSVVWLGIIQHHSLTHSLKHACLHSPPSIKLLTPHATVFWYLS